MRTQSLRIPLAVLLASMSVGAFADEHGSHGKREWSFHVNDETTPAEMGLPAYPGARPHKDDDDSSSAANLGFSSPGFGMELKAASFETNDHPERVAKFYRKALSKYGDVLDCSDPETRSWSKNHRDENVLTCDSNDTDKLVYKVGSKKNQRIVAVETSRDNTRFSLVHLRIRE